MTSESQSQSSHSHSQRYAGVLFIATAGQNGILLGTDEEEVVLFLFAILDLEKNEVITTKHYTVQPRTSDINENILSEECKLEFKISDEVIKCSKAIEVVIEEIEDLVREHQIESNFTLLVEGQLPLRQCLHPEASAKDFNLPEYYNSFFDLKKEFSLKYNQTFDDVSEMFQHLNIEPVDDSMVTKLYQMIAIVQRMITDGHTFTNPELIQMKLEPGICSRGEEVDGNCVVRARGLPWQSSDQDIAKFFRGLNIAKGGVALCLSQQGRRNGEALIRFDNEEHREMALKRHKHHIGTRYIEVYKATGEDFISVAGGNNNEAQAFLTKGAQVIIRMRGLPYDCTAKLVLEFFAGGENPCEVLDAEEGVLFVRRPDGRATGDAFVLFKLEEDSSKALSKHRESIGTRYIELFRSTTAEVQQVLNRCLEQIKPETAQLPLVSPVSPVSPQVPPVVLQQHIITTGTRKDCIRLRGLPYEAQVEHVLEFLGEHAKNIVFQGVHMVYNSQGQPSGEAFIQMDSEQSAYIAAQSKHHRYMVYFKKQRYIEVFQCSGEDMQFVLTGGLPSPQKFVSPGSTLLTSPYAHYQYTQPHHLISPRSNYGFQQIFYWPYSSPPVSPSTYYGHPALPGQMTPNNAILAQDCGIGALTLNTPKSIQQQGHFNHQERYDTHNGHMQNGHGRQDFIERLADKHRGLLHPTTKNYMELGLFMA